MIIFLLLGFLLLIIMSIRVAYYAYTVEDYSQTILVSLITLFFIACAVRCVLTL